MTQLVAEDESPFLVSMIHASRTSNCFFVLCVTQIFEITQEAYDKVSQGLFLTKSLQLPAKKKKKTPRNPRLSMRNIRDEQGETPLMEALTTR